MASSLVFGSTGVSGSHMLATLLANNSPSAVHTISRRAPKPTSPKLHATIEADVTQWPSKLAALAPPPVTVYSALGTTRQQAGGLANQWKIDHDLNVDVARAAKEAGVRNFVVVSSGGMRGPLSGPFPYAKMKRGVEDTVQALGFDTAIVLRPGLILDEREKPHQGGPLLIGAARGLGRWFGLGLQDRWAVEGEVLGRAAVHAARIAEEGKAPAKYWVLEQSDIIKLGRTEWKD